MGGRGGGFNVPPGGFGGGGGFESMFSGGAGGRRGGGSGQRQQQPRQAEELFPKNSSSGIAPLGKAKFPNKTSKYLWVVVFYDNNSESCAEIKPSLESFAMKMKGSFKVGAMNCQRGQADMDFCKQQEGVNVQNLPAFAFVVDGHIHVYEQEGKSPPSMKALHDFAVEKTPFNRVQTINHPTILETRLLEGSKKDKKLGSILLLTDKFETSSKYASLAYQFREDFNFGESRGKTLTMARHFNVKKYPMLIAFVQNETGEFDTIKLENAKSQDLGKWIGDLVSKYGKSKSKRRRR